ncbi:MAG: UvrD-helicase domain-containing protein [Candidatus Tectomicrobia bacterium]|nr:UvrD-helicase domain-containing protein [Candidatus Tectomicrobia bacterium]
MNPYLEDLTPSQREAVLHQGSPLLVLAGAGSGKTRVVTRRVAYWIASGLARPEEILALTFTNKAAAEMRERALCLLAGKREEAGDGAGGRSREPLDSPPQSGRLPWIATFHSACARILRREGRAVGLSPGFTIYDDADSAAAVAAVASDLGINREMYPPRALLAAIRRAKNQGLGPEDFQGLDFGLDARARQVYPAYQRRLRESDAADFDDLLLLTLRLFEDRPDVLAACRSRFRHVLVDEYQDTNGAQHRLLKLLAGDGENLCVVGDEDQSIYRWRGAEVEGILQFEREYPGARVIRLEENFRSSATILRGAAGVIARNRRRRAKSLVPTRAAGEKLTLYVARDETAEAEYVASQILSLAKGESPRERPTAAVFFRTHAQSRPFEEVFRRRRIPHRVVAGLRFFDRKEVKDLVTYLKVLANPRADDALLRILNAPPRGIGEATVSRLKEQAKEAGKPLWEAIGEAGDTFGGAAANRLAAFRALMEGLRREADRLPVADLVRGVLDRTGYGEFGRQAGREEVLEEFRRSVDEFQSRWMEANGEAPGLGEYLQETALLSDVDAPGEETGQVLLMTLHAAKGLEFETVLLTGVEDGLIPHGQSLRGPEGDVEEERRLFFVGMTRAKDRLFLTRALTRTLNGQTRSNPESLFLAEIPEDALVREGESALPDATLPSKRAPRGAVLKETTGLSSGRQDHRDPWAVGVRVIHEHFGPGTIVDRKGSGDDLQVSVRFAGGTKRLVVRYAPLRRAG